MTTKIISTKTTVRFKTNKRYRSSDSSDKCVVLEIIERNCHELKVERFSTDILNKEVFTTITRFAIDEEGSYEYFYYKGIKVTSKDIMPEMRKRLNIRKIRVERQVLDMTNDPLSVSF